MTNHEVTIAYAKIMQDLLDGRISIQESKQETKKVDVHAKAIKNRLKAFPVWLKIARSRNELLEHKAEEETLYCIPAASVECYPGLAEFKGGNITINGVEYCCLNGK